MSSFVHGDNIFVDLEILFVATFVKIIFQLKLEPLRNPLLSSTSLEPLYPLFSSTTPGTAAESSSFFDFPRNH
jgi:hypothetical protein